MPGVPPDLLGPEGEFGHREHLRLAWRELREHEREVALARIETAIRHVAEAHGAKMIKRLCDVEFGPGVLINVNLLRFISVPFVSEIPTCYLFAGSSFCASM